MTSSQDGQAKIEYVLILLFVAIIAIPTLTLLGPQIGSVYLKIIDALYLNTTENPNSIISTLNHFLLLIQDYYEQNDRYPRTWDPYNFTDLGLDPDDWDQPVDGIYWKPHGGDVGLANRPDDDIQIYVDDLSGNTLHLFDGWNIWCLASNGNCYYHTIAPGNEIDINTIKVINE